MTYNKISGASGWRLPIVPNAKFRNRSRFIKDQIHPIYLKKSQQNAAFYTFLVKFPTSLCSFGVSHMCSGFLVSFVLSISLSLLRGSSCTLGITLTLSGNAARSEKKDKGEDYKPRVAVGGRFRKILM